MHEGCEAQVMQLLGPCLLDLFLDCGRRFSLKTVLMLADQLLVAMESMHEKGYLHRDVKPDNVCIGTGDSADRLYLIDFGLSRKYVAGGVHVPCTTDNPFQGNFYWASNNVLRGHTSSRRDDLESLLYVFLYFLRGDLPWYYSKEARCSPLIVLQRRNLLTIADMCQGAPQALITALAYVKSISYSAVPRYDYLRKLFKDCAKEKGIEYDDMFDWKSQMVETNAECYVDDLMIMKSREQIRSQEADTKEVFSQKRKRRSSFCPVKSTSHRRRKSVSKRSSFKDDCDLSLHAKLTQLKIPDKRPGLLMEKCKSPSLPPQSHESLRRPTAAHSTGEIYHMHGLVGQRGFALDLLPVPDDCKSGSDEEDKVLTPKSNSPVLNTGVRAKIEALKIGITLR